jgi:hypothetical protein
MKALVSVWFSPRFSMRAARDRADGILLFFLLWAWGAVQVLSSAEGKCWQVHSLPLTTLASVLVEGLVFGHLGMHSLGLRVRLTDRWFKGTASSPEIRRGMILGAKPTTVCLLGYLVLLVVSGFLMVVVLAVALLLPEQLARRDLALTPGGSERASGRARVSRRVASGLAGNPIGRSAVRRCAKPCNRA